MPGINDYGVVGAGNTAEEMANYERMLELALQAGFLQRQKQAEGMPATAQMTRAIAPVPTPPGFTPLTPWEGPGMPDALAYSPMAPPAPPARPEPPKPRGGETYLHNIRGAYDAFDLFGRTPRGRPF